MSFRGTFLTSEQTTAFSDAADLPLDLAKSLRTTDVDLVIREFVIELYQDHLRWGDFDSKQGTNRHSVQSVTWPAPVTTAQVGHVTVTCVFGNQRRDPDPTR